MALFKNFYKYINSKMQIPKEVFRNKYKINADEKFVADFAFIWSSIH